MIVFILQCMLMVGTIIGPGTIFLMLVGAFVAAFKISNWNSFNYNLVPIAIYTITCLVLPSRFQLILSGILSTGYALVMMAVIVGTSLQLGEDGIGSPSAIFLIIMVGSFFIAACLHPQEFWCIVPGLIYLLAIPAMYLLLIIYSITNLNVVSWGTREVAAKKTKKELEEEKKNAAIMQKKAKKEGLWGLLSSTSFKPGEGEEEGGIDFSLGNVLRCMCFTQPKGVQERQQLVRIADSLDVLTKKMEAIESHQMDPHGLTKKQRRKSSRMSVSHGGDHISVVGEIPGAEDDDDNLSTSRASTATTEHHEKRDDLVNPYWCEENCLSRSEMDYLSGPETQFWIDLIDKYLHPIDADPIVKARLEQGLKDLRNKMVFFFYVCNALFVLIIFMLTLHKDTLYVNWPLGVRENITITEDEQIIVTKDYLHLEPIGIVLVFFFSLIIVIQFVAMLFHRFATISHILASTDLTRPKEEGITEQDLIEKNAVEIVKQMQRLRGKDATQ
jgi:chitin synthase